MGRAKGTFLIKEVADDGSLIGIRKSGNEERPGVVRALKEGVPIPPGGEILNAVYRGTNELELREPEDASKGGHGPAKVTTREYRQNYDKVFNRKDLN